MCKLARWRCSHNYILHVLFRNSVDKFFSYLHRVAWHCGISELWWLLLIFLLPSPHGVERIYTFVFMAVFRRVCVCVCVLLGGCAVSDWKRHQSLLCASILRSFHLRKIINYARKCHFFTLLQFSRNCYYIVIKFTYFNFFPSHFCYLFDSLFCFARFIV